MVIIKGKEKWSKYFTRCKKCKTTENSHVQHGFCTKCWAKKRYKLNREYSSNYYKKRWAEKSNELTKND